MLKGDTVFHLRVVITIQFLSYLLMKSWLYFSMDLPHKVFWASPQELLQQKGRLNSIMQSLNPLLRHGSRAVSVTGCVTLLPSTYLKVSPGASRTEDDSFMSGTARAALEDVWLVLRCGCKEQTLGVGDCARVTLL